MIDESKINRPRVRYGVVPSGTVLENDYFLKKEINRLEKIGGQVTAVPYLLLKDDTFGEGRTDEILLNDGLIFTDHEKVHQWLNSEL